MLNKDDVLSYYIDDDNSLYQMIGYCPFPTVVMKNLITGEIQHVVPDCLNAKSFHKLIKEHS